MSGCWRGAEYLVSGDGYRIVLESLEHYTKRLRSMGDDPQLGGAGMFAMTIQQAAAKRSPIANRTLKDVREFLAGARKAASLSDDVPTMVSALECYEADIRRALGGSEYHVKMVGRLDAADSTMRAIGEAKSEIGRFE